MTVPARMSVPALSSDASLSSYLLQIKRFPILTAQEEYMLAKRWVSHQDTAAAHSLVTSHLRLVAKVAMKYKGYGLPMSDLISEGNIGLMQSVKKFDPEKGFRLATYAMWWIRASIQDYILRSWSLVKLGTTAVQKRLFFNLRRIKGEIAALEEGDLSPEHVQEIAKNLDVTEDDVISMNRRIAGDRSLNVTFNPEGDEEWQDGLEDKRPLQDAVLVDQQESQNRSRLLETALATLTPRERDIFTQRRLRDDPETLEVLSQRYGISRERVRQIESRAFERVRKETLALPSAASAQSISPA